MLVSNVLFLSVSLSVSVSPMEGIVGLAHKHSICTVAVAEGVGGLGGC